MTQITAKIIADSSNEYGNRITTFVCTYPRIIHAEVMTHRMFSRNAASSRAIPVKKLIESVKNNPFVPIAFQKEHSGMQGNEYIEDTSLLVEKWLQARDSAIHHAQQMLDFGATKQLINRLLEPYQWYTSIITATEWENFFALRCPQYELYAGPENTNEYLCKGRSWKDFMKSNNGLAGDFDTDNVVERLKLNKGQAEIHMMALAEAMWDAYNESTPKELKAGEWHIPFSVEPREENQIKQFSDLVRNGIVKDGWEAQIKIATARCARVSYTVVGEEGKPDNYENDIKLHDRLAASGHWSPFEHCAKVMDELEYYERYSGIYPTLKEQDGDIFNAEAYCTGEYKNTITNGNHGWSGNFRGFIQYRKMFDNENITK
jgi:thymidylate synthase ThyX